MKVFVRGDKVVTKDGKDATVKEGKPDGFVVIKEQGKRTGRSVWSGNLNLRKKDNT